jgi:hypothetical protein
VVVFIQVCSFVPKGGNESLVVGPMCECVSFVPNCEEHEEKLQMLLEAYGVDAL